MASRTAKIGRTANGNDQGRRHSRRAVLAYTGGLGLSVAAARTGIPAAAQNTGTPATGQMTIERGYMRATEGEVKRGGVVRWSGQIGLTHFDLHQGSNSWAMCHMYNTLVRRNLVDGLRTIIPDLAESWEISPDETEYTFHLRPGVTFHNGAPFSAEDVEATFSRIISPPEGMASVLRDLFAAVQAIEVVDPMTVIFRLDRAQPWTLELFTNPAAVIYSKAYLEENDFDLRGAIAPGTGAFVNREFREGEIWIMERNPNYWDPELPYVDGMELLHLPEWTDRGVAVLTGQADLTLNTSVEMFEEGQRNSDIVTSQQHPSTGIYKLTFNCTREPFSDPRVRRAIHLGVSRQNLLAAFGRYEGVKLTRWLPRASDYATPENELRAIPGYREDKTADIGEALRLLSEAGYADGFEGVELSVASVASHAEVLAPAIQEQLAQLNIQATLRVMERAVLTEEQLAGNFDLAVEGTTMPPVLDPVPQWETTFATGGALNFGGYSNPDIDAIIERLKEVTTFEERVPLAAEGQDLLDQNPPWLVVGWVDHNPMWQNYVKGLALGERVMSELGRLETIWLDK